MKTKAIPKSKPKRTRNRYPRGWNKKKIHELADYYDNQTEDQAVAEDEAAFNDPARAVVLVPWALVPQVHSLIARNETRIARRSRTRVR